MVGELVQRAKIFATEKHEGQFRKDGVTPYITHPEALVNLLICIGVRDEDILASTWLHDVMEDCGVSRIDLENRFNSNVAYIVAELTRDCGREEYNQRIRNSEFAVRIIKMADMIHNSSDYVSKKRRQDAYHMYFDLCKNTFEPLYHLLKANITRNS